MPDKKIREEFEELAGLALDQELSHEQWERFEFILDTYPELEQEWQEGLNTLQMVRDAHILPVDLEEVKKSSRINSLFPLRRPIAVAVAATLLFLLLPSLFYFFNAFSDQSRMLPLAVSWSSTKGSCYDKSGIRNQKQAPMESQIAVGKGSLCQFSFDFAKEIQMVVSGPARIRYQLKSEKTSKRQQLRIILDQGELLIRSADAYPGGHLLVESRGITIRTLGTIFFVSSSDRYFSATGSEPESQKSPRRVHVELFEGKLSIEPAVPARMDDPDHAIFLSAGEVWSGFAKANTLIGDQSKMEKNRKSIIEKGVSGSLSMNDYLTLFSNRSGEKKENSLIQKIITLDGKEYIGLLSQTKEGYSIFTVEGDKYIPRDKIRQIDFLQEP